MPRIILLLAIAIVFYLLVQRVNRMPPHKRRGEFLKIALVATLGLALVLTLAGKMHWVGAALTGLLVALRQSIPLLIRFFPLLGSLRGRAQANPQQSTLNTELLRMVLDHESGHLSGEVLVGPYAGWRLNDLDDQQLREFMTFCLDNDEESAQLLEGYLEQRFGADQGESGAEDSPPPASGMTRAEALSILGIR